MANVENLKKGKATQFKSGENAAENGKKGGSQQEEKIMDHEILATQEAERLKALLSDSGVSENYISVISSVIENTAWMKVKLDEAREKIKTSSVVIPYDNGGNQKGIRENPLFKGYHSLFKSYMSGMNVLISFMPKIDAQEIAPVETPKTVLQLVREKREQKA